MKEPRFSAALVLVVLIALSLYLPFAPTFAKTPYNPFGVMIGKEQSNV